MLSRVKSWLSESKKAAICLTIVMLLEQAALALVKSTFHTFTPSYTKLRSSSVIVVSSVFSGTYSVLSPLFGWMADRRFGYYTILVSALLLYTLSSIPLCYAIGSVLAYDESDDTDVSSRKAAYSIGIVGTAFGAAATRATLIPYTLEQFSDGTESHSTISNLVTISYLSAMIGELLALIIDIGLVYSNLPNYKFCIYFLIPVSFSFALFLLIIWRRNLRTHAKLDYSPSVCNIIATGCGCYISSDPPYYDRRELPIKNEEEKQCDRRDEHRQRLGVIIPILFSLIPFFAVYTQIRQTFVAQASHMDIAQDSRRQRWDKQDQNITSQYCKANTISRIVVPAEVVHVGCIASIVIMIPIATCIVPKLYVRWLNRAPAMLERICIGLLLCTLSCVFATITEVIRINAGEMHHICVSIPMHCCRSQLIIYSSVSVLVQIPQHLSLGLGSALIAISVREFTLSRAPCEFRCTAYSATFFIKGLGTFAGLLIIVVIKKAHCYYDQPIDPLRVHENITRLLHNESESKAWVCYTVLTIIMIVSVSIFLWVKYRHKDVSRKERDHIYKQSC